MQNTIAAVPPQTKSSILATLSKRPNGSYRINRPEPRCDRILKTGRKAGAAHGVTGTHYDPIARENLCKQHASTTRSSRIGSGRSWYEDACETPGHENHAACAIGYDGVKRCLPCSFEYELARPLPVLDEKYWADLRAGAFA